MKYVPARGVPWARIREQVGQRNLAVTANKHVHTRARRRRRVDYDRC